MPDVLPPGPDCGAGPAGLLDIPALLPAPVVEAASVFIQVGRDWVSINSAAEKIPDALPDSGDAGNVGPVVDLRDAPIVGGLPGSILRSHSGRLDSSIKAWP